MKILGMNRKKQIVLEHVFAASKPSSKRYSGVKHAMESELLGTPTVSTDFECRIAEPGSYTRLQMANLDGKISTRF